MIEVLPLLALPSLAALTLWQRRERRSAHLDLQMAIHAYGGPPVTDAGPASLMAVARSLTVDPADMPPAAPRPEGRGTQEASVWETGEIIRPLGLEIVEVVGAGEPGGRRPLAPHGNTEIRGMRHGRMVVVRLREASTEVVIEAHVPPFALRGAMDGWDDVCDAPPEVREVLGSLMPNRRWQGLQVTGGEDGVRLHRAQDSARSWMHDLWLAELLTSHALRSAESLV